MTLNKIIYDVKESIRQYVDDSTIDDRYILYLINNKRSKYIRQDLNNYNKSPDDSIKQSVCLTLQKTTANECGLELDCDIIYRSMDPIPTPIDLHTKPAITRIAPVNIISKPFTFTTRERASNHMESRFNNIPAAFLHTDSHVYIVGADNALRLLNKINVTGVFEDPMELAKYKNKDGDPCFDEDNYNYPIQPRYLDVITTEIAQQLIGSKTIPTDNTNDSKDN